uniref:COMM domain-containing protein n=1 Tax=Syphacia muris TaxID=451379 RepID=A0A0N5A9N8_9BILA
MLFQSVIKFKHWCNKCVDKLLSKKEWTDEEITSLCPETTSSDVETVKAMLATLSFVLEKAAKSNCCAGDLELEMQQLGLPPAPSLIPVKGSHLETDEKNKSYLLEFTSTTGEEVSIVMDENKLKFLSKELNEALQLVSKYTKNA